MTEKVVQENEEMVEISIDDLEMLVSQTGKENINISEMLETEMVASRTLYLNQQIDTDTVAHIIQLIRKWNLDDYGLDVNERLPITIVCNSGGGSLYDALEVVSAVEQSITPIHTIGQGIVASAAFVIFESGHVRLLSRFANLMYHELRASNPESTLREMQNTVKHYEYLQELMDDYIVERTEVPKKKLKKKRKKNLDWFITIDEATKWKMYDELID